MLLTGLAGLPLGQGRGALLGLSAWLAGWALGALVAGRSSRTPRTLLLGGGGVAAVGGLISAAGLLGLGRSDLGLLTTPLAMAAIALPAFGQGLLLPAIGRALAARSGHDHQASWLLGCNLLGSVVGARWIGFDLPARFGGVYGGLGGAALCLVVALLLGWWLTGEVPGEVEVSSSAEANEEDSGRKSLTRARFALALAAVWQLASQWTALRLGALHLGGMQPALTAVLSASLLAHALGAGVLARFIPRGPRALPAVLFLAAFGTWLLASPFLQARVAEADGMFTRALWLTLPTLTPFGALVPALHRSLEGESGRRLGDLLGAEALGAIAAGALITLLLVPLGGLPAVLGGGLACGALAAAWGAAGTWRLATPVALTGLAALVASGPSPARYTPALDRPEFELVSFAEDQDFAVSVVQDSLRGERTLLTDNFRATATGDDYLYMQALGHLPLLLHPNPREVAVLAFGTGTTAGTVAQHGGVERIHVLEISSQVLAVAGEFDEVNHGVLDDPRTTVHVGDGRRTLAGLAGRLDVLSMEPLLPDAPAAVYLYTPGFYARARSALAPGGLCCQWVPPHALRPATFEAVISAFTREWPWSGVFLFGAQVVLIGAESRPALSPNRFAAEGLPLEDLERLGLECPAGIVARFISDGEPWSDLTRPLRDADPWILYEPPARGLATLAWLPDNLRALRERPEPPPRDWVAACDSAQYERRTTGARAARDAREALERERYGFDLTDLEPSTVYEAIAAKNTPDDPELRLVRFLRAYDQGRLLLQSGNGPAALSALATAAELRPTRADVHLAVALAADRAGLRTASLAALRKALALCPRLPDTRAGTNLLSLGFSPDFRKSLTR